MKLSKVGNQTNSQDPTAVQSRVFVGNLNTFQCSKTDLERMFQRYGRLAGISMHKGYAFIQFSNPHDARSACLGEDGRTVLGQTLALSSPPLTVHRVQCNAFYHFCTLAIHLNLYFRSVVDLSLRYERMGVLCQRFEGYPEEQMPSCHL
ncbi:hypothetical protein M8J77_000631 [Diaphorina citri]|nr:hypothetical protein M8J77_000631 [Diaphorina citri]